MLPILITLAGTVALLLWGTHMVQTGVQRAFGARLQRFLGTALRNRVTGFMAGVGVTAILQSSTATGLIISGFAAAGMVELMPAMAVMLGANVGTTLIVQVLSFDVSAATPAFILVGVVLFRRYRSGRLHDMGRVFIGLGLMLLALHSLLQTMTPYEDAPGFRATLAFVASVPLLAVTFSAVVTWLMHSSVAIILVAMSLASRGIITPETALAFVLGANLGTAVNPVIEGSAGSNLEKKRLPVANLLARAGGVLVLLTGLAPVSRLFMALGPDAAHAVANFHTAFNVLLAIVLLPALESYTRFIVRLLPARVDPNNASKPQFLESAALQTPIVALDAATREAQRLTGLLDTMLGRSGDALAVGRRAGLAESKTLGQHMRKLGQAIHSYLAQLDLEELGEEDRERSSAIFAFVSNLLWATDTLEKGLQRLAASRLTDGLVLGPADRTYLVTVLGRLRNNVRDASALLLSGDPVAAQALAHEKRTFRKLEGQASRLHFEQLRTGVDDGGFRLELIRELKQLNAYLVAAAAYPILEKHGGLLDSRVAASADVRNTSDGRDRTDDRDGQA